MKLPIFSGWWARRLAYLPATKQDLKELQEIIAMKASELKGTVDQLKAQVIKIWGEQQTRYDALKNAYDELVAGAGDAELPADFVEDLKDFQRQLNAFDAVIPDTDSSAPTGDTVSPPVA